jgi:hypothetical protein
MTFDEFWPKLKPCYICGKQEHTIHEGTSTSEADILYCEKHPEVRVGSKNKNLSKQLDYMLKAWNKMYEENTSKLGRYLHGTEDEP